MVTYGVFNLADLEPLYIWLVATMVIFLLIRAYISDRSQCYKQWIIATLIISIVVMYPLLSLVHQGGHTAVMALIALTAIVSSSMGPEIVLLAGFFKKTVRYSGVGFSHGFAFSVITG